MAQRGSRMVVSTSSAPNRRRACQPVNQSLPPADARLIQTELAEDAVHPADGRGSGAWPCCSGSCPCAWL